MTISNKRKGIILRSKIEAYENTIYDAQLLVQVARAINDNTMLTDNQQKITNCLTALKLLNAELEQLLEEKENDHDVPS